MMTPAVETTKPAKTHRQRSIAKLANRSLLKGNKQKGRPSIYTKQIDNEIIKRISNGETLSVIAKDLGFYQDCVYEWMNKHKDFADRYNKAREKQAASLINELIDETKELQNDRALAMRVRSDLLKWYAARVAPTEFGEVKRVELKGEITHTHIHDLADHQKRKIAEAWLLSQVEDSPAISVETTGPDLPALEGVAVREIQDGDKGIVPERKRTAAPRPGGKGRGRPKKAKPDIEKE